MPSVGIVLSLELHLELAVIFKVQLVDPSSSVFFSRPSSNFGRVVIIPIKA